MQSMWGFAALYGHVLSVIHEQEVVGSAPLCDVCLAAEAVSAQQASFVVRQTIHNPAPCAVQAAFLQPWACFVGCAR